MGPSAVGIAIARSFDKRRRFGPGAWRRLLFAFAVAAAISGVSQIHAARTAEAKRTTQVFDFDGRFVQRDIPGAQGATIAASTSVEGTGAVGARVRFTVLDPNSREAASTMRIVDACSSKTGNDGWQEEAAQPSTQAHNGNT